MLKMKRKQGGPFHLAPCIYAVHRGCNMANMATQTILSKKLYELPVHKVSIIASSSQ